jgi:hypothetical protein
MDNKTQNILQKFSKHKVEKVELGGFISKFESAFNKANDGGENISLKLIDALSTAEQKYKQNLSYWKEAITLGEQVEELFDEVGAPVPNDIKNKILSCKSEIKEETKYITAIKAFYGKF